MRSAAFPILFLLPLGGCAGNLADYVGSRAEIVAPELVRYGLSEPQARCVGDRLAGSLDPLQLRRLARSAGAVERGYYDPQRLTVRDLMHVASSESDDAIGIEVARATAACDALPEMAVRRTTGAAAAEGGAADAAEGADAGVAAADAAARPVVWLNLGAAPTGQAIAVEASSLEQEASLRKGWFRLTNPGAAGPNGVSYLLRIDCAGRTIEALAHRQQDESGALVEQTDYSTTDGAGPIEGGTVMEIAYLALCT